MGLIKPTSASRSQTPPPEHPGYMSVDDFTKTPMPDEARFCRLLSHQLGRYPQLEVQDLYKLVFQASFGSEHAIGDPVAARLWLERERQTLAPGSREPIVDPISPDGRLVRIHLRPYLAAGRDLAQLSEAFVRTAREYRGTEAALRRYWRYAERMAAVGLLPFAREALRGFFVAMQAEGFPAVHHSDTYARSYRPAYRVIVHSFLA
jgi:hypothetical protein